MIPLSAVGFMECMAEAALARELLQQGLVAREKLLRTDPQSSSGIFYRGKIETARFFCRHILTNVFSRQATLQEEDTSVLDIPTESF